MGNQTRTFPAYWKTTHRQRSIKLVIRHIKQGLDINMEAKSDQNIL